MNSRPDVDMEKLTEHVLDRLCKPVGEIIVQWGVTDIMVHYLGFSMQKHLGKEPRTWGWPFMFGRRLAKLESLFQDREEFITLSSDAGDLFKKIRHHQKLRDMLVHGAAVRYDTKRDAVLFRRIDPTPKEVRRQDPDHTHQQHRMTVPFEMLQRAAANCVVLNSSLVELRGRVLALGSSSAA